VLIATLVLMVSAMRSDRGCENGGERGS
jgi:hypothetical protein